MNLFREGGPFVIGHRGSPRGALENTLGSFDLAEADAADGLELDVRLTYDGEAVVFHDAELVRGDRRLPLGSLTLLDVKAAPARKGDLEGEVPSLREVFLRYGGAARYLVELKSGPSPRPSLLEHRVTNLLVAFGLVDKAAVLSFSPEMLRRVKEIRPEVETVLVYDGTVYRPEGQLWPVLPQGCTMIAPHHALAGERLFEDARAAGLSVHVWTVNEPELAERLARLGARSVISDVPAEIGPAVRSVNGRTGGFGLRLAGPTAESAPETAADTTVPEAPAAAAVEPEA